MSIVSARPAFWSLSRDASPGAARRWLGLLFILTLAALTSACGSSSRSFGDIGTGTTTPATVTSISVEPTNTSLPRGLTRQFTAIALYSDGTKLDVSSSVTWSSSATNVATVTTTGVVTALNFGATTVSAAIGTVSGSATLTVSAATLVTIDVTPVSPAIAKGTLQLFTATGIYTDYSTQDISTMVTWSSSNPLVATISNAPGSMGIATGLSGGKSTMTATLGTATGSTVLTVSGATLLTINVTPATASIPLGAQQQFTATGVYSDGTQQLLTNAVTWSSSSTVVATISNATGSQGLTTAAATGVTTISAAADGLTGTATLTVTAASLVSIAVTPAAPSIANGTTIQFMAIGTFSDRSTQDITAMATWRSTAATVATITNASPASGVAHGLQAGMTGITATLSGVTSPQIILTVTPAILVSISVTPANPSTFIGHTVAFIATGTFSDLTTQVLTINVAWTSQNMTAASISNAAGSKGLASALSIGSTLITATDPTTLISGSTTLTVSSSHAYATNLGSNTISQYDIGLDGTLTPLVTQGGPVPTAPAGQLPFSITITPSNTFAYVANSNGNDSLNADTISQYAVSAVDGSLSPLLTATVPTGMVASGINPNSVTLDPSATHLYATNFDYATPQNAPGSISQYTIGQDGSLAPIAGPLPVTGIEPASLAINPAGTFAYVANYNNGQTGSVSQYNIVNGALVPMMTPSVPAGAAPNFIIVDPSGQYVYVANQFSANISEYTINQMTGALTANTIQTVVATLAQPRFIAINAAGTYAYVANYGADQVSQYSIVNGVLTPMTPPAVSTGAASAPNGVTIDATGKYLYVADRGSAAISQFAISPINGSLAPLPPLPASNMVGAGIKPTSIATTH